MNAVDMIALALAASAVVDVWHNGSIFANRRAMYQAREDYSYVEADEADELESQTAEEPHEAATPWQAPLWFCRLMNCPYCLSHHTPWVLGVLFFLPAIMLHEPWSFLCKLPVYSLACTRLGFVLCAMLPETARYLRSEDD